MSRFNPDIHHRRSIRLKGYDYSQAGAYFVTICALHRECLFGEIVNSEMVLSDSGRIVANEWDKISMVRKGIELDIYSIMPNHFHAIIFFTDTVGATPTARPVSFATPTARPGVKGDVATNGGRPVGIAFRPQRVPTGPASGSIGAIMAQFKSRVTKNVAKLTNNPGCSVWQKSYYERVIRNDDELSRTREYIVNNPMKWELDNENPINYP